VDNPVSPPFDPMDSRPVRSGQYLRAIGFLAIGVAVTPITLLLTFLSGGGGHGDYVVARLLYPLPLLLTMLTGNVISGLSVVLAFVRFPLYGLFAGYRPLFAVVVLIGHFLAVFFCFSGLI
jgi:hypothetical protein